MKWINKTKINLPSIIPDLPILNISREFFPTWIKQKPGKYRCPVCRRPHHIEPGPFTYGIAINTDERKVYLWVKSFGCCGTKQEFPYQSIKEHNIDIENIVPILKKVFKIK